MPKCRCGWDSEEGGDHPCHGDGYKCKKPSQHLFYNPTVTALAGAQMKMVMYDTWSCAECWEKFKRLQAIQQVGEEEYKHS